MNPWDADPAFADLKHVAEQLEAAVAAANAALLKTAGIEPEQVVDAYVAVQTRLLRFDAHAEQRFRQMLEEKRVKTLSQGNIFIACVLTSAVALSEFKSQPRRLAGGGILARQLERLREGSTNGISLGVFAYLCFNTLLGKGAWRYLGEFRQARKALAAARV